MASLAEILRGDATTLIVHNHLQQITGFVRGGGVEFLPLVDPEGSRKSLIDGLVRDNKLRAAINCMTVKLLKEGKILLYLRPIPGSYRIHWYSAEQYQLDYDRYGEIEAATIVYAYKRRDPSTGQERDRWVRIRLTAHTVQVTESDSKLAFAAAAAGDVPEIGPNRLGFVPCVEVLNPTPGSEVDGVSDFAAIAQHIEAHDELTQAIIEAIIFYCQSPILTSRDASEISESGISGDAMPPQSSQTWEGHQSVSYASGFRDTVGTGRAARSRRRLKRVIGGIDPQDDMFQQLSVSGVSGEAIQYADAFERQLREAMGGLLERGIETAAETRVVYGKVQATARDKQVALFENGLCRLFEMAILAEEALHLASSGAQGLPLLGDRRVNYRIAPIFLESTNETLQKSIVSRNLMRQGVNAKEALKFVFPDKSESELDVLVGSGGLPTEFLESAMRIMSQLLALKTQDAATGLELPVSDPWTGEPLYRTVIPFITQSLDYGTQFRTVTPTSAPNATNRDRAAVVAAVASIQRPDGILSTDNPTVAGDAAGGQLSAADPTESIPDPGSTQRGPDLLNWERSPILSGLRSAIGR